MNITKSLSLFAVSIIVAAGLSSCQKSDTANGKPADEMYTVETSTVEIAPMSATLKATGTLEGIREANVTSETQGRIVSVACNNGSRVGAGSALVTVDNELKLISVQQAEASRLAAEAGLEKAKLDLGRTENLTRDNAVTKSQLEGAQLMVKSAEAQLKAAQGGEALAKRQLADANVKAPFAGTVAMRYVNLGELLGPGTKVATLVDDSKMKLRVNIGELDVPLVKLGDKVTVAVDAISGKTFAGEITSISTKADMARAFVAEIEIPNDDKALKSGMFARAEIKREAAHDVATVPVNAVITNGQKTQVFTIENNIAKLKAVKIGTATAERVEITEGLNKGETVVTFGQNQLRDGSKVRISK
jgi:RND family efflux transporter MFP subunit